MSAVAYASLIRLIRTLEEGDLYSHEVDVLRAAADARLLADPDASTRLADAEELLTWLAAEERLEPETIEQIRGTLMQIAGVPPEPGPGDPAAPPRPGRLRALFLLLTCRADELPRPCDEVVEPADPRPAESEDARGLFEGAERLLAFHAWLDEQGRR